MYTLRKHTQSLHACVILYAMNIVVGVLRGGPSHKYDKSLETGRVMLSNLSHEQYVPRDIFIDKKGVWHVAGKAMSPTRILEMVDVVLVGLHGEYGEDGEVQKILQSHGVPYSGSNSYASFLATHKVFAKKYANENNVLTPRYILIESPSNIENSAHVAVRSFIPPVVVKPARLDSSNSISFATGYQELQESISTLFKAGTQNVLLEEYIRGKNVTVGVIEHFRSEKFYTLPPAQVISVDNDDSAISQAKGNSVEVNVLCPATLSPSQKDELKNVAIMMHRVLGLRHYSSSDFIVTPHNTYHLKTNPLPRLAEQSVFPKMLEAVGEAPSHFTQHLINLALRNDTDF